MARPPGAEGRFNLSPRSRWIAGWVVAILLIGGIALAFNLAGGNADGTAVGPTPSPSAAAQQGGITFGTTLGPTRAVAPGSTTTRFAAGDTFAYSVAAEGSPPPVVYVEVVTADGGPVQPVEDGRQPVPPGEAIGFSVPADDLLDVFGPGSYVMRIYAAPGTDPLAEGSFELVEAAASPVPSGG